MSKTYVLQFDTGNAAFEGAGRDAEVAAVILRAADKIEQSGLDGSFKVWDTNGNSIGGFSEVTPPASSTDDVVLSIETGNAAFEGDPSTEVVRILRNAAKRIEQGDWPTGLLDINGNRVGNAEDNRGDPEIELPEDISRYSVQAIREKNPEVRLSSTPESIASLSAELGLQAFGESWRTIAVVRDEEGDYSEAWVTQHNDPVDSLKHFVQVMRNGMPEDWAEAHEAELNGVPAPRGFR